MTSRKDYEAIASIIKNNYDVSTEPVRFVLRDMTDQIAQYFVADNSRFNREKFVIACGICEHSFIDSDNDGEYGKEHCRFCGFEQNI